MDAFHSLPAVQESPPRLDGKGSGRMPVAEDSSSSSSTGGRTSNGHEKRYHSDSNLNQISLEYSYAELIEATNNFDDSAKLGSGSYGSVYKGTLKDGTEVAIKVVDLPNEAGFEDEVRVLSKFRHPNLVILMGFARNGSQRLLVYECLSGGDVSVRLQKCAREGVPFPWQQRLSIALDAACGLSHLHNAKPKVFHRDIKSPNILLDRNSTAKMADFGLACLSHSQSHKVKQASGTIGYACPYYIQRGVVTEASEVYSFGMVLLELLLNAPPACPGPKPGEILYLVNHLNGDLMRCLAMVDPRAGYPPAVSKQLAELALNCASMNEQNRPTFVQVVKSLRTMLVTAEGGTPQPSPSVMLGGSSTGPFTGFSIQPGLFLPPKQHLSVLSPSTPVPQPFRPLSNASSTQGDQQQQQQASRLSPPPPPRGASLSTALGPPMHNTGSSVSTAHDNKVVEVPGKAQENVATLMTLTCILWDTPEGVDNSGPPSSSVSSVSTPAPAPTVSPNKPVLMHWDHQCHLTTELLAEGCPRQSRLVAQYPPLRLGRNHQVALFDSLVRSPTLRTTISREHLEFTFEGIGDAIGVFVTNLSVNSVFINETRLLTKGERFGPLKDGDTISFVAVHTAMLEEGRSAVSSSLSEEPTPFLAFRVDLAQSWLGRMGLLASFPASASASQQQQGVVSTPLAASQLEPVCRSREDANLGGKEEQQQPCVCVLEIRSDEGGGDCGGSGMEIEHRSTDVPLLVGRSRQPQLLWQLLKGEYNAVSREHFEIRPIRRDPQGPTEGDARHYAFKLKCLSCNGITLIEGGGGGGEKPKRHFLSQNDAEVEVYHGDELAIAGLIRFLFIDCINPPASAVRPLSARLLTPTITPEGSPATTAQEGGMSSSTSREGGGRGRLSVSAFSCPEDEDLDEKFQPFKPVAPARPLRPPVALLSSTTDHCTVPGDAAGDGHLSSRKTTNSNATTGPLTPNHLFDPQDENDAFAQSGFQLVQDSKGVRVAAATGAVVAGADKPSKHQSNNKSNSSEDKRLGGGGGSRQTGGSSSKTGVSAWTKFSSVTAGLFKHKSSSSSSAAAGASKHNS